MRRRWMQSILGIAWLFDGILQFRPRMLGSGFVTHAVLTLANGEPLWLHRFVLWNAQLLLWHPVIADATVGTIQIGLGVWLIRGHYARWALSSSIVWALVVWVVGEAFGGLFTGACWLSDGAPGAALLYGLLSLGLWPTWRRNQRLIYFQTLAASLWAFESLLWLLPSARLGLGHTMGVEHIGSLTGLTLCALIAALLISPRGATIGSLSATGMALLIWTFKEKLGEFWQPYATDINSGLLLALISVGAFIFQRRARPSSGHQDAQPRNDPQHLS